MVGQYVELKPELVCRVLINIDSYYSYEVQSADGSFRVFDSYVRAGLEYEGKLPPNRVKMRHEVLVDLGAMSPYGVLNFIGMAFSNLDLLRICLRNIIFGLLKVTLLAIYRAWARDDRQRLVEPPRGRRRTHLDELNFEPITRRDIETLIGELFASNCSAERGSRANSLYEKLGRDREIEGRVCRGEDRIEVRYNSRDFILSQNFRFYDVGCYYPTGATSIT